ncbi:hypothetical protein LWM68_27045 [Niabella sp. W65]|nr:hypothetical protein [Niabella sp. W65]MCH7366103.1 hypothetical protein [Niabella sp. W65]
MDFWSLHRDHHDHSNEASLERNDWFFVIFAIPTIILLYFGVRDNFGAAFFIGLGIFLYGMSYFLCMIFLYTSALKFSGIPKTRISWPFAGRINSITSI